MIKVTMSREVWHRNAGLDKISKALGREIVDLDEGERELCTEKKSGSVQFFDREGNHVRAHATCNRNVTLEFYSMEPPA